MESLVLFRCYENVNKIEGVETEPANMIPINPEGQASCQRPRQALAALGQSCWSRRSSRAYGDKAARSSVNRPPLATHPKLTCCRMLAQKAMSASSLLWWNKSVCCSSARKALPLIR